jgi:hypothetical protein
MRRPLLVTGALLLAAAPLAAQQPAAPAARTEADAARAVTRLVAEPASVAIEAGQTVPLKVTAYDAEGRVVADAPVRVAGPRGAVLVMGD